MIARGLLLLWALLAVGCASTTVIQTDPPGAEITLDGRAAGESPVTHKDRKIVGMSTQVGIRKSGFQDLDTAFRRNETWVPGSLALFFFYYPLLWCRGYEDSRTYVLTPMAGREKAWFDQAPVDPAALRIDTGTATGAVTEAEAQAEAAKPAADKRMAGTSGKRGVAPFEIGGGTHIAAGTVVFLAGFATSLGALTLDQSSPQTQLLEAGAFIIWVGGIFEIVHGFRELARQKRAVRNKRGAAPPKLEGGLSR